MNPEIVSVSQFLGIINETLGFAYPQVIVEGEVSSFKINQGKFAFFDLKDEQNVLSCFMMARQLVMPLEDGMKVRVTGSPKVTRFSKFSLTARSVELAGEGELKRAMELLRRKLEAEGLFAPERKRALPRFPQRLGLITSSTSAAYSDFIKILGARWGGLDVILADVTVQGVTAPEQVVGALEYFNQLAEPVDVVVLIRGGGSLEDLAAFSTEPVARAVAASRTPIVVGVGHEVDVSLADYAADVRAATPTDAARLVVPDRSELLGVVASHEQQLSTRLGHTVTTASHRVDRAMGRLEGALAAPREAVAAHTASLWRQFERLEAARGRREVYVATLAGRLGIAHSGQLRRATQAVTSLTRLVQGYDPTAALRRGYAIVRRGSEIIRDPAAIQAGETLMIQLAKGTLKAEAKDKT